MACFTANKVRPLPVTQDNTRLAPPSALAPVSTSSSSAPLQNTTTTLSLGPEPIDTLAAGAPTENMDDIQVPQDSQSAMTMPGPTPIDTPAAGALTRNADNIQVPQDSQPAVTMLRPAPIDTPAAAPIRDAHDIQLLKQKRYTRTEKMHPGHGCTVRYVCIPRVAV